MTVTPSHWQAQARFMHLRLEPQAARLALHDIIMIYDIMIHDIVILPMLRLSDAIVGFEKSMISYIYHIMLLKL